MKENKMNRITRSLWFVAVLVLWSCGGAEPVAVEEAHDESSDVVELTDVQYKTAGIETGHLEMRTMSGSIEASGVLDTPPQSKISVSAPMGGFVKHTDLLQGSFVKKGQVVVVMENQDYIQLQQDYLENFSQLEFLKAELDRQELLAKENVNARKSVEEARANYNTTKATVQGLKAKLNMLHIPIDKLEKGEIQSTVNLYAPISGYVTCVYTNIGAFVNPTDVLMEIVNTEDLHAELTVFEKDIPLINVGQRVLFTLSGEDHPREARVQLIGREIGEERSIQVHCDILKDDRELMPGMYLQALIETDSNYITTVPEEAVVYFEGKSYIYIPVEEGHDHSGEEHKHNEDVARDAEEEHSHDESEAHDHGDEAAHHTFQMIEVGVGESEQGYVALILPENFDHDAPIVIKGAYSLLAKMKNGEESGHAH